MELTMQIIHMQKFKLLSIFFVKFASKNMIYIIRIIT